MGVKLSPDPMPEQAVFVRSDHYAMAKKGIPAVMLATGMANGGDKAWATYLSNNYHRPSDDMSLPILWIAGAKFAELNYRVVRALADGTPDRDGMPGTTSATCLLPKPRKPPRPVAVSLDGCLYNSRTEPDGQRLPWSRRSPLAGFGCPPRAGLPFED